MERCCVLVVDDRIENRDSISALLAFEGYATQHAQSVTEAMDHLRCSAIDMVLTDVRMEHDGDGLELLRRVKANWPVMPVVVYTGFGSVSDAVLAMRIGAADYLEWPTEPDSILAAIKAALERATSSAGFAPRSGPEARLSASTRWASYVLKAVNSPEDPKTLSAWARCAGVSYTSLREACYLSGIHPHDARDFARALRVVVRLSRSALKLTRLLDIADRRTLRKFCQRAGLSIAATSHVMTVEAFLQNQTLIPRDNEGVKAVE